MSSNEISGSFMSLRGQTCNFTNIEGVSSLNTKSGVDLVNIADGLHESLSSFQKTMNDLLDRVKKLEANGPNVATEEPLMGPAGKDGRDAKAFKLEELKNVKVPAGDLKDGSMLAYSLKDKVWIAVQVASEE